MKKYLLLVLMAFTFMPGYSQIEREEKEEVFVIVEVTPEFPGGMKELYDFLGKKLKYPQAAIDNKIEGRVFVNFIVDETGKITNPKILRDIGFGCGEEVIRVVNSMPLWKPGEQRGKPVKVSFNLPVRFTLPAEELKKQPGNRENKNIDNNKKLD